MSKSNSSFLSTVAETFAAAGKGALFGAGAALAFMALTMGSPKEADTRPNVGPCSSERITHE